MVARFETTVSRNAIAPERKRYLRPMPMPARERLESMIARERPDRFAVSCWRHFFETEHDREKNLEALLWFQEKFGWDFVKLNSPADYHVEGWGLQIEYSRKEFEKHSKSNYPVRVLDDWSKIVSLPLSTKALADELWKCSRMRAQLGPDVPILMTVFSPLAIAARMVESEKVLLNAIQQDSTLVKQALEAITKTFENFALEARNAGADGIFFATSHWATKRKFSWADYKEHFLPFDKRVVAATGENALNMLHLCDNETMLTEFASSHFPAKFINWSAVDPTNLPLDKGVEAMPEMICVGGIDQEGWLLQSTPDEVAWLTRQLMKKHDPSRVILAAGCTVDPRVPMSNLQAMKDSIG